MTRGGRCQVSHAMDARLKIVRPWISTRHTRHAVTLPVPVRILRVNRPLCRYPGDGSGAPHPSPAVTEHVRRPRPNRIVLASDRMPLACVYGRWCQ